MSQNKSADKPVSQRRFVLSLAVSALAIALSNTIITLLLLEVASTFQVQEGIAAQTRTANAAAELVFALLMGFLATRFRHKSLLLIGVLLVTVSAVGTFLAPSLEIMLIFSFLEGLGTVTVTIMTLTIIGDLLPPNQKSKAVIWVVIAGFVSTLAGTPTINYIAGIGGWRYAFLLLVVPVSITALILARFSIPSSKSNYSPQNAHKRGVHLRDLKLVFLNKSALSFLVGSLCFTGVANAIFVLAFFRQQFSLPLEHVVYVVLLGASIYIITGTLTRKLENKFGAKPLTVTGALGSGILIVLTFFAADLWTALALNFMQAFFTAMAVAAFPCLGLDQVPEARCTMMSLTRIFANVGCTIAPAISGSLLVIFSTQSVGVGYQAVGITFGVMNIIAAFILQALTKDTTRLSKSEQNAVLDYEPCY